MLLIKGWFIPTDIESIQYMNMVPVSSTGRNKMWLMAKHDNLKEKQKSTIPSLEIILVLF